MIARIYKPMYHEHSVFFFWLSFLVAYTCWTEKTERITVVELDIGFSSFSNFFFKYFYNSSAFI